MRSIEVLEVLAPAGCDEMRAVEVTDALQAYLDGLVPERDPVLARMEQEADREGIPIVDAHEGAFLSLLVRIAGVKRILELGTATGYSGIWLLRGTDGGLLTTFEFDGKRAARARANFAESGLGKQAIVLEQDAVSGLEKLQGRFDACVHRPAQLVPFRGRDTALPGAVHRAPGGRRAAHGRQRAAPGRGGEAENPAGAERCVLQRAGS
ncbi:MAG TPA: hypothetical protein VIO80_13625, partial [Candidatus Dormibacteraeota bacterium]